MPTYTIAVQLCGGFTIEVKAPDEEQAHLIARQTPLSLLDIETYEIADIETVKVEGEEEEEPVITAKMLEAQGQLRLI